MVEEGAGGVPVPEVGVIGVEVCGVSVLEGGTVDGLGFEEVASGSLPAAFASVTLKEGLVSSKNAQCGMEVLE